MTPRKCQDIVTWIILKLYFFDYYTEKEEPEANKEKEEDPRVKKAKTCDFACEYFDLCHHCHYWLTRVWLGIDP